MVSRCFQSSISVNLLRMRSMSESWPSSARSHPPVPPLGRQLRRCRCAPIITRRVTRRRVTRRGAPGIRDFNSPVASAPTEVELTGSVHTEEARGECFPIACRSLGGPREEAEGANTFVDLVLLQAQRWFVIQEPTNHVPNCPRALGPQQNVQGPVAMHRKQC